ncbi:MAG: hypothetical protein HY685_04470, partial [Chloroflexi bacterium]|nr:hypothetical protein [Chloroflexota bacterium]
MSPFQLSPFQLSPFQLSPLSTMSFNGLDGAGISGTDINFAELGLSEILSGEVKVAGFSANRGLKDEAVLVRTDVAGTQVFAIVVGSNGAHSLAPYTLQIETSMPYDQAALDTGLAGCQPRTVSEGVGPGFGLPYSASLDPTTLLVTQAGRLGASDGAFWNTLKSLADHSAINGKIVSAPISAYAAWDNDPCSVEAANEVTDAIRDMILNELQSNPSIEFVVLVGSDDVVPFRRVADDTIVSNERHYLMSSFLRPGSPLFASVQQGYNLSDDFYVDVEPSPWQGRALFIPDLPIGRLVETPSEIAAAAQAFLNSNGQLNPISGFVTGYDFFKDGSEAMANALGAKLATNTLVNDQWSADQLRCKYLGRDSGTYTNCGPQVPGVNGINAHYTHFAALSAGGFTSGVSTDFLTSKEVAAPQGNAPSLERVLVFTMGCHAGLNVPSGSESAADPGLGIDSGLDFAQAMAIQRAIYVASTGYGLGDDEGIGGTERLMLNFAQELMKSGATAGTALVQAKHRYLGSLSAMTVYDEKSSIQTTLYGLPQYAVNAPAGPGTVTSNPSPAFQTTPRALGKLGLSGFGGSNSPSLFRALSIQQQAPQGLSVTPIFQAVSTANGTYYTVGGDAQATAGRPIQPRVLFEDITGGSQDPAHGVLITGGLFSDQENLNPVIARPTIEWEQNVSEPQTCLPAFWPSQLASVNTLDVGGGLLQTLVVIPGQFRCTSEGAPTVIGTQRLFNSLALELQRSPSSDFEAPIITSLDAQQGEAGALALTVRATDPSGISRIVVLVINEALGTLTSLEPGFSEGAPGAFTLTIPEPGENTLVLQVVDGAGNVAAATGKGANLSVITLAAAAEATVNENSPITLSATVTNFASLTGPVSYSWEFGDGAFATGQTADGTIAAVHTYPDDNPTGTPSDEYVTTLKVTDAAGGIGTANTVVTVLNVVPVVTPTSVTSPINEDGVANLAGSFTDVGVQDTHTATVNWGDGTIEPLPIVQGAGSGTYAASHRYLDDNPTGTPSDNYTITVTVTDDDTGAGTGAIIVTVNNVAPTVEAGPDQLASEGQTVSLASTLFHDIGTLDTHTATI